MINNLNSILTQSSLSTEAPIFVVYSKQPIVVDSDYDYDEVIYVRGEDELSAEIFEELESVNEAAIGYRYTTYKEKPNEIDSPIPKDPFDDERDFDPDDWEKRHIKFVDKFEQAFFIRENAQRFLDNQSHNLGEKSYIYVESAYRNPEWQQIREFLISEAKKKENTFGELKFGLKYEDIVDGMFVVYSELPLSNYANSLKQIWKTEKGWRETTLALEWEGKYSQDEKYYWSCDFRHIWDEKCYAPVEYDETIQPVDFMNKVLLLTIKGPQDT